MLVDPLQFFSLDTAGKSVAVIEVGRDEDFEIVDNLVRRKLLQEFNIEMIEVLK